MNRCRECLAETSPGALHCPQCGRELGPPVTLPPPGSSGQAGNWRVATIVFAVIGVLMLLAIIGTVFDPWSGDSIAPPDQINMAGAAPPPGPPRDLVATTAEDIGKAYDENELTARDRFEGRPIRVTGTVLRIASNQGEPTLLLQSSHAMQAAFVDAVPLKALKAGEQVTITCEALSTVDGGLVLKNCALNTQGERAAPVERRTGPQ